MGIAVRNEGAKVNSNINVTPMVDVMLVLLIIFMVVTPMLHKGVDVNMAKVENPTAMTMASSLSASCMSLAVFVRAKSTGWSFCNMGVTTMKMISNTSMISAMGMTLGVDI